MQATTGRPVACAAAVASAASATSDIVSIGNAVGAGVGNGLGLLGEGGFQVRLRSPGPSSASSRWDRTRRRPRPGRRRLGERDFHAGPVDLRHFLGQPMPGENEAVGPERVGQNHPAAGLDVAAGDFFDLLGLREIPGVGASADRQSPLLELRAQGAVESRPARPTSVFAMVGCMGDSVCVSKYTLILNRDRAKRGTVTSIKRPLSEPRRSTSWSMSIPSALSPAERCVIAFGRHPLP